MDGGGRAACRISPEVIVAGNDRKTTFAGILARAEQRHELADLFLRPRDVPDPLQGMGRRYGPYRPVREYPTRAKCYCALNSRTPLEEDHDGPEDHQSLRPLHPWRHEPARVSR